MGREGREERAWRAETERAGGKRERRKGRAREGKRGSEEQIDRRGVEERRKEEYSQMSDHSQTHPDPLPPPC